MKTMQEVEQELLVKEQKVSYLEKLGIVPSMSNLVLFNDANREVGV